MSDPVFLPYVRRGLAQAAGQPDPLTGPLPARAEVRATVELVDSAGAVATATTTRRLAGPADAVGVDPAQIIRFEPAPGTTDFETPYLAFAELVAPDLPWLLTPASPTADGALRPWLVVVVVEESSTVTFETRDDGVDVLHISADDVPAELWDLADSHVWSHAQSSADDIDVSLDAGSGEVFARLICPRKLKVDREYRAAIVPAFDAGVAAGLGLPFDAEDIAPAWDLDAPADVSLPVYATWTFATSDVPGDFESLAVRLQPDTDGGRMGFRDARLDPGQMLPAADPELGMDFEFAGALIDPGQQADRLPDDSAAWLTAELVRAIDDGQVRADVAEVAPADYDPERDDPALAPHLHGRWAAAVEAVPASGWVHEVNLDPATRAAASLGAEVVRQSEHQFLAAAWDQVGALREAAVEVNRTRLVAEIADRQLSRLADLDDATLLFVTGPITRHVGVRVAATGVGGLGSQPGEFVRETVAKALASDPVLPAGAVSAAFFRAGRRGSSLDRQPSLPAIDGTGRVPVDDVGSSTAVRVGSTFVTAATSIGGGEEVRSAKSFKSTFVPDGAVLGAGASGAASSGGRGVIDRDDLLADLGVVSGGVAGAVSGGLAGGVAGGVAGGLAGGVADGLDPVSGALVDHGVVTVGSPDVGVPLPLLDVAEIMRVLSPRGAAVQQVSVRLTGVDIDAAFPADGSRSRIIVGPWFPDGLSPKLQALSAEFLLPGVGAFAMDRVRLLEINEPFVAAFLIGANHEWAREALWREFPADLAATAFASLFDRPGDPPAPGEDTDLNTELAAVPTTDQLASMIGGEGSGTVLLMRAELVRRFPGLIITLLEPDADGGVPLTEDDALMSENVLAPMFVGRLDASTIFVGFDIDPSVLLDDGWFVSVEEQPSGTRFGFDGGRHDVNPTPPDRWTDLTWADVLQGDTGATHVRLQTLGWDGEERHGITWGRNGAHQARIAFQQPFRMVFPAGALIIGADS